MINLLGFLFAFIISVIAVCGAFYGAVVLLTETCKGIKWLYREYIKKIDSEMQFLIDLIGSVDYKRVEVVHKEESLFVKASSRTFRFKINEEEYEIFIADINDIAEEGDIKQNRKVILSWENSFLPQRFYKTFNQIVAYRLKYKENKCMRSDYVM